MNTAHRLPTENGEPQIIAKFNNREKKNAIVRASKKVKLDTSFLQTERITPIFCDDHLTPSNKKIVSAAKQLRRDGLIKYVWVADCTIRIRVDDNSPAITVRNLDQIYDIRGEMEMQINGEGPLPQDPTAQTGGNKKKTVAERSLSNVDSSKKTKRKMLKPKG